MSMTVLMYEYDSDEYKAINHPGVQAVHLQD